MATLPSGATANASPAKDSPVRVYPAGGIQAAWETETRQNRTTTEMRASRSCIGRSFLRSNSPFTPIRAATRSSKRKRKTLGLAVPKQSGRKGRGEAAMQNGPPRLRDQSRDVAQSPRVLDV